MPTLWRVAKLFGVGTALVLLALAAGNSGQVGLAQVVRTLSGHTYGVTSVAFSPDGRLLASGSRDYTIKLWDISALVRR